MGFFVGGTSVPTLSAPIAAIRKKSIGTEVPPTTAPTGANEKARRSGPFPVRSQRALTAAPRSTSARCCR
ncbi:DUF6053 domain-containing protein [Lysobacter enzymogenes]|uniref:DUF6053 domain-containing protein n=1 Tax=Lysobacter enzymogenes TaxID=69 RepID=UPI003D18B8DA